MKIDLYIAFQKKNGAKLNPLVNHF